MKRTMEERARLSLVKFGKKNILCKIIALPVLILCNIFWNIVKYFKNNGKRFLMLGVTCFFFAVYSSFSFPVFISGNGGNGEFVIDEASEKLELAIEVEPEPKDMEWIEDSEVAEAGDFSGDEKGYHVSEGINIEDIIGADENIETYDADYRRDEIDLTNVSFSKDDWRLILINKSHYIPDDYEFPFGTIKTLKGNMQCDERIIDDLIAMQTAAWNDGVSLEICSPYRDMDYQIMLFKRKIDKYMGRGMSYMEAYKIASPTVTVPGASEHQIGLALDIVTDDYTELNEGFGDTEAGKWLVDNSYKYGFILRYPKGKEHITCIEFEPWHFRYVGVEAATYITKKGITLEEFWEEL